MDNNNNIFYGIPPKECRLFLADYLKKNVGKFKRFANPTSGRMASTMTMILAGTKKKEIFNYDIGFVPVVLGYHFSNQDPGDLEIKIIHPPYGNIGVSTEELLFISKLSQILPNNAYIEQIRDSIINNKEEHISHIKSLLEDYKDILNDSHFEIKDLNDTLEEFNNEDDFVYFDPPIYGGDYDNAEKCLEEVIQWARPNIKMFNPNELDGFFEKLARSKATIMLYYNVPDTSKSYDFPKGWRKVFVKKVNDKRSIYLLMNRNFAKEVAITNITKFEKGKFRIFTDVSEITNKSKVTFKKLDNNQAGYYRNLFIHKLKSGSGVELNIGLFIDGKIFAVCGFMVGDAIKSNNGQIYKLFGITIKHKKYPKLSNFGTLIMQTREFKKFILESLNFGVSEDLTGIKTTTFSNRKTARMDERFCEKVGEKFDKVQNRYALQYLSKFQDKSLKEARGQYLQEELRYKKSKGGKNGKNN